MYVKLQKVIKATPRGFTLIELLVVLGILGILAAVLLAAINPIEQLNKAQDASDKQIATEYVAATTQYYSVHNTVPFDTVANGGATGCNGASGGTTFTDKTLIALGACTTQLIAQGELKASFSNVTNLKNIHVTTTLPAGTSTYTVFACFQPKSHAGQLDSNTKYNIDYSGNPGVGCISGGGASACVWCAQ